MRQQLVHLVREEVKNAKKGLPSGIVVKINSLEDKELIDEFYKASKAGVPIRFVVRGICCLRPGRAGLSENIEVRSIVGDYLEHSRLFYFHQAGEPKVLAGSADVMVRSFDRRIEALFVIVNPQIKREAISILMMNLLDNQNSYLMREDGAYIRLQPRPRRAHRGTCTAPSTRPPPKCWPTPPPRACWSCWSTRSAAPWKTSPPTSARRPPSPRPATSPSPSPWKTP